jgi:hypothetical protein
MLNLDLGRKQLQISLIDTNPILFHLQLSACHFLRQDVAGQVRKSSRVRQRHSSRHHQRADHLQLALAHRTHYARGSLHHLQEHRHSSGFKWTVRDTRISLRLLLCRIYLLIMS